MTDDLEGIDKLSYPMLVSQELIDDCHVNLLDYLRNPYLKREPVVLTRRQKIAARWRTLRVRAGEAAYRIVAGEDVPEPYDE